MIQINAQESYALDQVLFTFALPAEAADVFTPYRHLICGIGKLQAAYHLSKAIHANRPALIVNLGSAGSAHFPKGSLVCCNAFIQRDMDVRGLGYALYETPLSRQEPLLKYGLSMPGLPTAVCGTGDNFEMAHSGTQYQVVDMEAYALAYVARQEGIPFLSLKYITDGADGDAPEDWTVQVHHTAHVFARILDLPGYTEQRTSDLNSDKINNVQADN